MPTLKRITWMLLICLAVTGTMLGQTSMAAQTGQPGGKRGQGPNDRVPPPEVPDSARAVEIVDSLTAVLSLTEAEQEAVLKLHMAHFAKAKALMAQAKDDRENHRNQMDALRADFLDDMKELLSKEQFEQFEGLMKKRDQRSGPPKRRGK